MQRVVGVLVVELPVAAIFLSRDAARLLDLSKRRAVDEIVDHRRHRAEEFREAFTGGRLTAEDEAAIAFDARHLRQRQARILDVEAGRQALPVRHAVEDAVEAEGPGVIGAGEAAGIAALHGADLRAAMSAAVDEGMDAPVAPARDDQVLRARAGADEVARRSDLALVRQEQPGAPEDALHLE